MGRTANTQIKDVREGGRLETHSPIDARLPFLITQGNEPRVCFANMRNEGGVPEPHGQFSQYGDSRPEIGNDGQDEWAGINHMGRTSIGRWAATTQQLRVGLIDHAMEPVGEQSRLDHLKDFLAKIREMEFDDNASKLINNLDCTL